MILWYKFRRMIHFIEQKENKRKLLIDPLSKFHSTINKDLIDYEHNLGIMPRKDILLGGSSLNQH